MGRRHGFADYSLFRVGPEAFAYGGAMAGKRKIKRPLVPGRPLHLCLMATAAAALASAGRGNLNLRHARHSARVERILRTRAAECGVRLARYANMGTSLHLVLRTPSRKAFQRFLRISTGLIARAVTGSKKGRAYGAARGRHYWQGLAYTRVLVSTREEKTAVLELERRAQDPERFSAASLSLFLSRGVRSRWQTTS